MDEYIRILGLSAELSGRMLHVIDPDGETVAMFELSPGEAETFARGDTVVVRHDGETFSVSLSGIED